MGCQKEIARDRSSTGGGDFVIAVKDNQPKLREAIEAYFVEAPGARPGGPQVSVPRDAATPGTAGIDERSYFLAKVPRDFAPKKEWPWVKAIGYAVRITQHADGTRDGRGAVLHLQPLSQRQAVRRGGPRPLGHRVDALGAGRELPRGRQPHPRADLGQQPELAAALRRDPAEASSRSRTASAAR